MKKTTLIFFLFLFYSCNKDNKHSISNIIDCDKTASYKSYYEALSDDYKTLLKEDFRTSLEHFGVNTSDLKIIPLN